MSTTRFIRDPHRDEKNIRFVNRPDKIDKKGLTPINMVISVEGQKKFYRLKEKVFPPNWDYIGQRAVFLNKEQAKKVIAGCDLSKVNSEVQIKAIKKEMDDLRAEVEKIKTQFKWNDIKYTSQKIKDELLKKKAEGSETEKEPEKEKVEKDSVINFIGKYIKDNTKFHSKGTLKVFGQLKQHLTDMAADPEADEKRSIAFENMDEDFMGNLQNFLIKKKNLANVTTAKQMSILKTILKRAKKKKVNQDYKDFEIIEVPEEEDIVALDENELNTLVNMKLPSGGRLDKARDIFVMGCVTGLRYSDLAQLDWSHILPKGTEITLKTVKSGFKTTVIIPLTPIANAILKKYKETPKPLPADFLVKKGKEIGEFAIMSDQKLNETLQGWTTEDKSGKKTHFKGLCELAGFTRMTAKVRRQGGEGTPTNHPLHSLISIHTARRTFISQCLRKGIPPQNVMKMSGHKSYNSFKLYIKIFTGHNDELMKETGFGKLPEKTTELKAV